MKVTALAGGVGGAKLLDGLAQVLPASGLRAIVNTADDFEHLGLHISPDLDTVVYSLAGVASRQRGWGRSDEAWLALDTIGQLGGPTWFNLGDRDLGLHLMRSHWLRQAVPLSEVTARICRALGVEISVLPMSDQPVHTIVETDRGSLPFQSYFVEHRCQPVVHGFAFAGIESAQPGPGVMQALDWADVVVFCPSNPWVSLDPILALPGVRLMLRDKLVVAVSPIVGGLAIKGPAAKMFSEMGFKPSASAVAQHYRPLLTGFVLDESDEAEAETVAALGIETSAQQTIMRSRADRAALARSVLAFAERLAAGVPA
jgi:LPPG:FO 2-phospho-L-lactate transferase